MKLLRRLEAIGQSTSTYNGYSEEQLLASFVNVAGEQDALAWAQCNAKALGALSQMEQEIATNRNFAVQCIGLPDQTCELLFVPDSLHRFNPFASIRTVNAWEYLDGTYQIVHGDKALCHNHLRLLSLPLERKDTTAFVYDLLHEADHAKLKYVNVDPEFLRILHEIVGEIREGSASKEHVRGRIQELLSIVDAFQPDEVIAAGNRDNIRRLLTEEVPIRDYLSEQDKIDSIKEHRAWEAAETQHKQLESIGFEFNFPEEDRSKYTALNLLGYELTRLAKHLVARGKSAIGNIQPAYVTRDMIPPEMRKFYKEEE